MSRTWQCAARMTVQLNLVDADAPAKFGPHRQSIREHEAPCILTSGHAEHRHLSKAPDGTFFWWSVEQPPELTITIGDSP